MIAKIVVGGLLGWVASILMHTNAQMGLIANVVVGIIGSGLGHFLGERMGKDSNSGAVGWAISAGGAVLLIFILKALGVYA
jgi:uncharacterized membrane protein YeaQ/YmgE (transglycosylase-associated protein family)